MTLTNKEITFKYHFYEIEADAPRFNYHGPKIKISKQESPITICTADTIGAIKSQRLFRVLFDSGSNVSMINPFLPRVSFRCPFSVGHSYLPQ